MKYKANDIIDRHKARLIAKGFTQHSSIDFLHTFCLVARLSIMWVLLVMAAQQQWHLLQLHINKALSNGTLEEDFCMKLPMGNHIEDRHITWFIN